MKRTWQFAVSLFLFSCSNVSEPNQPKKDTVQEFSEDSLTIIDGDIVQDDYEIPKDACFYPIFANADKKLTNNIVLIKDGTETTVRRLIRNDYTGTAYASSAKEDIDNDGQKELWIRGYSGGAHCCDEWQIFLGQANGKYLLADSLLAGHLCFDGKLFTFEFTEQLGYFMSCYACGFEDSASGFLPMREIKLKYQKSKFEIVPYSINEEKQLIKNLSILQKNIRKPTDEEILISSLKKEFAMNIAVYYFNNKKNWVAAKSLFDKYYTFKDRETFIGELKEHIDYIDNGNSF